MFKQQKQIITDFVKSNPKLSTKEIANQLGLNYNSVRGRVSELKKQKLLSVNDKNEYTITQNWYKKLLKTGKTTKPRTGRTSEQIEVITYEDNNEDRMQELLDGALENIDELEYIDELGYTSTPVKTLEVDNLYTFRSALLLIGLKKKTIQI